MVKSIQVLRIHLLELEKVNELCKDFCNRYIACLKGKLQSENILRTESSSGDSLDDSFDSPHQGLSQGSPGVSSGVTTMGGSTVVLQNAGGVQQAAVALNPGQIVSGGTVYQMVQTPQGIVAQPIQIQTAVQPQVASVIHGSTPLSQIGVPTVSTPVSRTQTVTSPHPSTPSMPLSPSEDEDSAKKKAKRGVLPKQATQVMKSWLFQHIVHPYPTEDEKRQIAGQTNLTLLQVNNWFINARRRILQPMLDASNPEGSKAKKNKPQNNRPVQRFWPDSIANLQPQPQQVSSLQQQQQQQQQQTSTGSTAGPTPGTITVVPYFSSDGQLISTQAVTLEALQTSALQTSHVNPMLSEAQPTGANSPTLMVQNGEQDEKDNEEEGALQSSDLGMENSDDDSDLVGDD
ncbi:homeobox protein PKNOX2-like [Lingula anatina]|uniref:Homeobox protein PKNOX2-like n=1 Tax=Lingula anatina TaxID=7574 RepID=A0A1S3IUD6_LINAN|nr:homeobox protein PKNOX2-like [Lingula anatina]|eukprot:XP_013401144.1 homeobox protein PKNOX2-like [Lingula anatina]